MRRYMSFALAALTAIACSKSKDSEPPRTWVVHGTVTERTSGRAIPGVAVVAYAGAAAGAGSATTDANGYFAVRDVPTSTQVVVAFAKGGYTPAQLTVGRIDPHGPPIDTTLLDASTTLELTPTLDVSGTVYAAGAPAPGARVYLYANGAGEYVADTRTGAAGTFSFPGVLVDRAYSVRVWPYDADEDGVAEYQLLDRSLGVIDAQANDYANLVLNLSAGRKEISASNVSGLAGRLVQATVVSGGLLPAGKESVLLHFGAPVNAATARFALHERFDGTRGSAIPLAVAWETNGSVVRLTPATAFVPDANPATGYALVISSLAWQDGSVSLRADAPDEMEVRFDVPALPADLASPQPAFFVANVMSGTRQATKVAVDSNGVRVLDANDDDVALWDYWTGFQLTWPEVPGAAGYALYARNRPGGAAALAGGDDAWHRLAATVASGVDAHGNPVVFASGVAQRDAAFWSGGLVTGSPLAFDNGMDLAVTALDAAGFESPVDPAKLLALDDAALPRLASARMRSDLSGALAERTEVGASFSRTVVLAFDEPVRTTATPTVVAASGNVTVRAATFAFDPYAGNPGAPQQWATQVAAKLDLHVRGSCTGLLGYRSGLETVIPVEDASLFAAGARAIVYQNGWSAPRVATPAEVGVVSADAAARTVTLSTALGTDVDETMQLCNVSAATAGERDRAQLVSLAPEGTAYAGVLSATLGSLAGFYENEFVLVYRDAANHAFGFVTYLDTETGAFLFTPVAAVGSYDATGMNSPATVVLPLHGYRTTSSAEVVLRDATYATLLADVRPPAAGNTWRARLSSNPYGAMVGDLVRLDLDGDAGTRADQVEGVVTKLQAVGRSEWWVEFSGPAAGPTFPAYTQLLFGGDAFRVGGVADTSATGSTLDPHGDAFGAFGGVF